MKRLALLGSLAISAVLSASIQTPVRADGGGDGRIVFHGAVVAPTCSLDPLPTRRVRTRALACGGARARSRVRVSSGFRQGRHDPLLRYYSRYGASASAPGVRVLTVQYD